MAVTRTIELTGIEPAELAAMFCGMTGDQQAEFFRHIGLIASEWPGAGWCWQSCDINRFLTSEGRDVIRTLAGHALDLPEQV